MPNGCKDYFHFFPWILHVSPPLHPRHHKAPLSQLLLSGGSRGRVGQCGGARKEGLGSILVISTKINTSLLGVRFIDPAAWVDLSPRVGREREQKWGWGVGVRDLFYLNQERYPASIQNLWIMDKGILWKTGKTLNEIQFTMAVIQMQNYWKSFGNQFWKIF